MTNEEKINLIGQKILVLSGNLDKYKTELNQLQQQLNFIQQQQSNSFKAPIIPPVIVPEPIKVEVKEEPVIVGVMQEIEPEIPVVKFSEPIITDIPKPQNFQSVPQSNFNFEEFIGSKLINIIGIVILVIGMGIGVKYAIDQNLLGPLARISLAYLAGGILLAFALKLKTNYKTFSAILLSGGMASLYFTTFAAYSIYSMFPQMVAFLIMVVFTAFTVFAATVYSLEVIGIVGLVGAYAVPMLLSDGSGKIEIMFCYMGIINVGILVLSFKKLWRILNHIAFAFTWLIVLGWFAKSYNYEVHTTMLMIFSFLFFIIFYISNLSYKVVKQEQFDVFDVVRIVMNSFIFFGIGYGALNNIRYHDYLGLFTLVNSIVHLVFSYLVFKNKLLDRKLFYLLIALVLSFLTIAVPVQLKGNWVTLFWSSEALLLFAIGRYKNVRFYEWLGFIMVALASFSLLGDWSRAYYSSYDEAYRTFTPFLNVHLFTSLFFIAILSSIMYVHFKKNITDEERSKFQVYQFAEYTIPILIFVIAYFSFRNEISFYFNLSYEKSLLKVPSKTTWAEPGAINEIYDSSLIKLKNVVSDIYSLIFLCIASAFTIRKWNNTAMRWGIVGLNLFFAIGFISFGLKGLEDLRDCYLHPENFEYYSYSSMYIYIRYLAFAFFFTLLYLTHLLLKAESFKDYKLPKIFSGSIIHFFILMVLSNELIHITILNNYGNEESYYSMTQSAYKLGLTALWGIYSFLLIAFGIFKKNKVIRISAISLFGITLVKLVTYDTWDLSTGYKVIAYMLLGVILLVVAFLYQKFKVLIFGDDNQPQS